MEPKLINTIRCALVDFIYPQVHELANFKSDAIEKAEKVFDDTIKTLDGVDVVQLSDMVLDISAEYLDVGFQNGFRLGVRLMLECLLN